MTDITERLRELPNRPIGIIELDEWMRWIDYASILAVEAADEIERLRAEREACIMCKCAAHDRQLAAQRR
jgi:hypothetical protein